MASGQYCPQRTVADDEVFLVCDNCMMCSVGGSFRCFLLEICCCLYQFDGKVSLACFEVDVCTPIERNGGPDVLKRATVRLMLQGHGGNVAYAGHLGGAAVGALAFVALRRGRMRW